MAQCHPPFPMKYYVAILFHRPDALDAAKWEITAVWGDLDYEGADHLFDVTEYYAPEMGSPLFRRMVSFAALMPPTALVEMKLRCNAIEDALAVGGKRIVNLDAGYLDHNKIILASAKEAGQKIYLDRGIYADFVGRYQRGNYQPFDWTFPDFRDGRYDQELLTMRKIYLGQMREWRNASPKDATP